MLKLQRWQLKQRQQLSLEHKITLTKRRIKQFYDKLDGQVYVSFSGGKDSTVLLHLVRSIYPDVVAVFVDTGLEFPEIKEFVKTIDNVITIKPKQSFPEVIKTKGYPVVSKEISQKIKEVRNTKSEKLKAIRLATSGNGHLPMKWRFLIDSPFKISDECCHVMKKRPAKKFEKESGKSAIVGTMASESRNRQTSYLRNGCNSFEGRKMSTPLAFWLEKDIWEYIELYNLEYSEIYKMGYERTGCMFCMFGLHLDKENRFDKMKRSHPKIYKYCMETLGLKKIIGLVNHPKYNPKKDKYFKPEW